MTRILQINLNRSRAAHELALSTAIELGIDILLVSEPNKNKSKSGWDLDQKSDAAIKRFNERARENGSEDGFVWQRHNNTTIYSCYISPNSGIEEFENYLGRLEASLLEQPRCQDILIAGDFNAASPIWGSSRANSRGKILEEWIAKLNLTVHNDGIKPTFQRGEQASHLDLTLTNERMKNRITSWMVLSDLESLSDHNYISFKIAQIDGTERRIPPRKDRIFDFEKCKQELEARLRGKSLTAGPFTKEVKRACEAATTETEPRKKKAYWFTEVVAGKRRECVKARRRFLRANPTNRATQKKEYDVCRSNLNREILRTKEQIWNELCEQVSINPWGTGYKIVMDRLNISNRPPPKEMLRVTLDTLFPDHPMENRDPNEAWSRRQQIREVTEDEVEEAMKKIAPNKAPGPDNITGKVIKYIMKHFRAEYKSTMNEVLRSRTFPKSWKKAKAVLIHKPGKPADLPNSYRPICLLSTLGKSLERILNERLIAELDEKKILHESQYGFRKGKSTIQAVRKLTDQVEEEFAKKNLSSRKLVLAILIDIKNAFNSLSWTAIKASLRENGISEDLTEILESYFSDREITSGGVKKTMTAGVPQGSQIGPTLWNLAYNGVFKLNLPFGSEIIGYADDIVVVIKDKDPKALESKGNECIKRIDRYLKTLKLEMAPQKSEAIIFSRKHQLEPVRIHHNGNQINISSSVKYLGITLDRKLTYVKHITGACEKAARIANSLNRILPRTSSTGEGKRKLLAKVSEQIVSYGAPIWDGALKLRKIKELLTKTQRINAIRVSRAYRTVYTPGILVIGRLIPWNIKFTVRRDMRNGQRQPENFEQECIDIWQEEWNAGSSESRGARIKKLIPDIGKWYYREHGELTYELTQFITGHGAFRDYLKRIKKRSSGECNLCGSGEKDDAEHAIFHCSYFNSARERWKQETEERITEENILTDMIESEKTWKLCSDFIKHVVGTKEALDRLEEQQSSETETD